MSFPRIRTGLGIIAGLLLVAGLWVGWQVWQVNRDLSDAVEHAENIQSAVEQRDTDALRSELDALRTASSAATNRTSGATWSFVEALPLFGDDAEGVEVASRVLDGLAADGIEPLVTVSERIDDLLPRDGAIDPAVVAEIAEPVAAAEQAFARAEQDLADVDPDGFVGRLGEQFTTFRDRVTQASSGLHSATIATEVLPSMLGGDGKRHYLLVFQNNAEVRATGGLPGAVSYVEADNGALALRKHVAGASFGEQAEPVLALTDAEVDLYDVVLGTYFLDANMTPDVPRAAELMKARWDLEYPKQSVDGVLMIDAVAIAYLLEATGPMTVDGIRLTSDNLVDELLHESYMRLPEPDAQDAFFAQVAFAAFEKFTAGVDNPAGLLRALGKAADERRVLVHSFDVAEQTKLSNTAIAGDYSGEGSGRDRPKVAVTLNDTTGAKMSYFLRYEVDVTPTACLGGVQTYSAKARVRSVAPPKAADLPGYITGAGQFGVEPGSQLVTLRIFGPVGGEIGDLDFNGKKMDLVRVQQDGRPVGMTYVQLQPGQTVDLAWTMKAGSGQTGDTEVIVTPTVQEKTSVQTLPSGCVGVK